MVDADIPPDAPTPEEWLAQQEGTEQLSNRLLRRLAFHGLGMEEMEQTEIAAAKEFLARTVPPKRSPEDESQKKQIVPVVNVWIGGRKVR